MTVRSISYDCEITDQVFCYFMRCLIHIQKNEVAALPLENSFQPPLHRMIDVSAELMGCSPLPEVAELILDAEYDHLISHEHLPVEIILALQLIKNLPAYLG